jgi:hypothetical protein
MNTDEHREIDKSVHQSSTTQLFFFLCVHPCSSAAILILAGVLTGLNALKPLHIDDATYYFYARQIAEHPLDPYGFTLLYWSEPLLALHVLAPPVLPYWWAGAIRLFGERPVLWKLWLFPFVLLFVAALASLLRRFAPTVAAPLLILLTLSPVFLPSLNLMIDVPALALSLASLALFFRACDRDAAAPAVWAGAIAGLAMQTKYTAFLAPAVLLIYALTQRRFRLGLFAAATAGLVFAAWEMALLGRYGDSHFLHHLGQGHYTDESKMHLIGNLFPLLGGLLPTLGVATFTILRWPRWAVQLAVVLMLLPYLLLICPESLSLGRSVYGLALGLFVCNGAAMLLGVVCATWRLSRREERTAWFLVLWLAVELAGYVTISPFSAVRRVMGITIAATLLLGYLAERSPLEPWRRKMLYGLVVTTTLLGFACFGVDYLEARAEQQAAYEAVQRIRQEHPQAVIWYTGYWGFQYYAEKCGMKQIIPVSHTGEETSMLLPPSRFHRGDWLVIPDENIPQHELNLDRPELEAEGEIALDDRIPLATLMNYYAGWLPLRHRSGPRIVLRLFRVNDDFTAR